MRLSIPSVETRRSKSEERLVDLTKSCSLTSIQYAATGS